MFATFVITIAIVTPMAAARLVEDRRHEWLFWTVVTVATVAHAETWRLTAAQQTVSYLAFMGGLSLAVYEILIISFTVGSFCTRDIK